MFKTPKLIWLIISLYHDINTINGQRFTHVMLILIISNHPLANVAYILYNISMATYYIWLLCTLRGKL